MADDPQHPVVDPLEKTMHASSDEAGVALSGLDRTLPANSTVGREALSFRPSLPPAKFSLAGAPELDVDFVLREELGRGGMGVVFLAGQKALDREVAIKRLVEPSPRLVDALLHEAMIAGGLEHPSIVPIHAVVEDEHGPAVVMKRISGREWAELIRDPETTLDRHLEVLVQVCNATAFAHSEGVVHRDIKPSNVMVGAFGEVYLMDWGIARRLSDQTRRGLAGTAAYLAPEMVDGTFDERSDVYLLGATLHEVLMRAPRHTAETLFEAVQQAIESAAFDYPASVPPLLGQICNRACARAPEDRFESVEALRDAVISFRAQRAAQDLVDVADARLETLSAALESDDYPSAKRAFDEARFAYEQAAAMAPDAAEAERGLQHALLLMARAELSRRQPDAAATHLEAMIDPPASLQRALDALRDEMASADQRLHSFERDQDKRFGKRGRDAALVGLGLGVLLIVGGFGTLRLAFPNYASAPLRFALVGLVVFLIAAGVVRWWRRRGEFNLVNRRISQVALTTLGCSAINRLVGLLGDIDPTRTLQTDALLIAMAGAGLTPFHRSGPWLAGLALVATVVGAVEPAWIEWIFVVLAGAIPLIFLATRKLVRRDPT